MLSPQTNWRMPIFSAVRAALENHLCTHLCKTINCMSPTAEGEACNQCESCTAFNEQRSYNIHELDAASNNSVDDIRQLVEQVRIPPQIGKYKVYIIDEVHMLSASAFNAFLKHWKNRHVTPYSSLPPPRSIKYCRQSCHAAKYTTSTALA